jgi:hypothetical protein
MKVKTGTLFFIFLCIISSVFCYAQEYGNETQGQSFWPSDIVDTGFNFMPTGINGTGFNFIGVTGREVRNPDFKLGPGMEVINIRGTNIVVPKGTKVQDMGSWIKFEDLGEYLGRQFDTIEKRFAQLEAAQGEIKKQLAEIKKTLDDIDKRSLASK